MTLFILFSYQEGQITIQPVLNWSKDWSTEICEEETKLLMTWIFVRFELRHIITQFTHILASCGHANLIDVYFASQTTLTIQIRILSQCQRFDSTPIYLRQHPSLLLDLYGPFPPALTVGLLTRGYPFRFVSSCLYCFFSIPEVQPSNGQNGYFISRIGTVFSQFPVSSHLPT